MFRFHGLGFRVQGLGYLVKVSLSQRVTVRRVVDLHIIWTSRLPINNSLSVVWGRHAGIH